MKHTLIAMAVAALCTAPFAASAAGYSKSGSTGAAGSTAGGGGTFARLDKNHDGKLSKKELKGTRQAKQFSKLDKNHDGKLSKAEYAAATRMGSSAVGGTSRSGKSGRKSKY